METLNLSPSTIKAIETDINSTRESGYTHINLLQDILESPESYTSYTITELLTYLTIITPRPFTSKQRLLILTLFQQQESPQGIKQTTYKKLLETGIDYHDIIIDSDDYIILRGYKKVTL